MSTTGLHFSFLNVDNAELISFHGLMAAAAAAAAAACAALPGPQWPMAQRTQRSLSRVEHSSLQHTPSHFIFMLRKISR